MPANNIRAFTNDELKALNDKYKISYIEKQRLILVENASCKRKTFHSIGSFGINSKNNPKRKVVFSDYVVKLWIDFQADERLKSRTLFDVQNAYAKLRLMYQPTTKQKIIELLTKGFFGIKKL